MGYFKTAQVVFCICLIVVCPSQQKDDNRRLKRQTTCDARYSSIRSDHTMCGQDNSAAIAVNLTDQVKQDIVDRHNVYRARQVGMVSMLNVVWDDEIAVIAAKMARQCRVGHDEFYQRWVPTLPGLYIGQNAAGGYDTFLSAIDGWYNEINSFEYGVGSTNGNTVLHYTQIVNEYVSRIGCGQAQCSEGGGRSTNYFICNYARGQLSKESSKPYCSSLDTTTTCPGCLRRNTQNLCDCRGKVCLNSGILNQTSCECICPSSGYFRGASCEILTCPSADGSVCSQYTPTFCDRFPTFVSTCPNMCKTCPRTCNKVCQNGGTQNTIPCICHCASGFSGEFCQLKVTDGVFSQWSEWNTATAPCPSTCGRSARKVVSRTRTCDSPAPTNGGRDCVGDRNQTRLDNCQLGECPACIKTCLNGGRLDQIPCICRCSSSFSGDRCQLQVINGGFSAWSEWNTASVPCPSPCGVTAIKVVRRSRVCDSPAPANGGQDCSGDRRQQKNVNCRLQECQSPTPCDVRYSSLRADHTMCGQDRTGSSPVILTEQQEQDIVDRHNKYRAQQIPRGAVGLMQVVWDEEIAVIAAKRARQCSTGHDEMSQRLVPTLPGVDIGQNVGAGFSDFQSVINTWYNEINNFQYGVGGIGGAVSHYTQIVNQHVSRIGCGQAVCVESGQPRNYFVCNYAKGQQQLAKPYCSSTDSSTTCLTCLKRSSQGLCDCGGKICMNNGNLNQTTCQCECPANNFYRGASCETLRCPDRDQPFCTNPSNCDRFANYISECPYSCRICPRNCSKVCQNGGTQNTIPCTCHCTPDYTGDQCQLPITDGIYSQWSEWNTATAPCPSTCGSSALKVVNRTRTCDSPAPANGGRDCVGDRNQTRLDNCGLSPCTTCNKVCQNGGTQNTIPCICHCASGFSGEFCQLIVTDGVFSQWSEWNTATAPCPSTCGSSARKVVSRTRTCDSPAPANGGQDCVGDRNQTRLDTCQLEECPACIKTCLNGGRLDQIPCICRCSSGFSGDRCQLQVINGGFSAWSGWNTASVPCPSPCGVAAIKVVRRSRVCDSPAPANGGQDCSGDRRQQKKVNCRLQECQSPTPCDVRYSSLRADHTMCGQDRTGSSPVILTEQQEQDIVDRHNTYRAQQIPRGAVGLMQVVWDEEIAVIAAKRARQCSTGHDEMSQRLVPTLPGVDIGQNVGAGFSDFQSVVDTWYNEINNFQYGVGGIGGTVSHYTQIVNQHVSRIGCGQAVCVESGQPRNYFVCNYAKRQQQLAKPYCSSTDPSTTCLTCLTRSSRGLCDCGGKICMNNGNLNQTTCQCECPANNFYRGASCETLRCPDRDQPFCTNPSNCDRFANYISECPYSCRICPRNCSKVCQNGGTQNTIPCTCHCTPDYTGDQCQLPITDGIYSQWSEWNTATAPCPSTCGSSALKVVSRTRTCDSPAPANGGRDCVGDRNQTRLDNCGLSPCTTCSGIFTIYFVVDASASITAVNFIKVKEALKLFVNESITRNNANRMGFVFYSDVVTDVIIASSNITALTIQINAARYSASGTYTDLGIDRAREELVTDQSGNPRLMIVITDGVSNEQNLTRTSASRAKASGIIIFAVGINLSVKLIPNLYQQYEQELADIATSNQTVYKLDNFNLLAESVSSIMSQLCETLVFISSMLRDLTSVVGTTPVLRVRLNRANVTNIMWKRETPNQGDLTSNSRYIKDVSGYIHTLAVPNVQLQDAGDYSFTVNLVRSTGKLIVLSAINNKTASLGERAVFQVQVAPSDTVGSWYKDGTRLPGLFNRYWIITTGQVRQLTVFNAQPSDEGVYRYTVNDVSVSGYLTVSVIPVDGGFSPWGPWNTASVNCTSTCGLDAVKVVSRFRTCTDPVPSNGGKICEGSLSETTEKSCNLTNPCPIDGGMSDWSRWGDIVCPVSCGFSPNGVRTRNRTCTNPVPSNGGKNCTAPTTDRQFRSCYPASCPIDGSISPWTQWGNPVCTASCGVNERGISTRFRFCNNPPPRFGGKNCTETREETAEKPCPDKPCPVDGVWGAWSAWFRTCSRTCGGRVSGTERRIRLCDSPPPTNRGRQCEGRADEIQPVVCDVVLCQVNGSYGPWTQWTEISCAATCGENVTSIQRRTRACNSPSPSNGGRPCTGDPTERRNGICENIDICPVDGNWGPWDDWLVACGDATCGFNVRGYRTRFRLCDNPRNRGTGRFCLGETFQLEQIQCPKPRCPINGGFTDWSQWDNPQCSVSCGGGNRTRTRRRTCTQPPPQFNGNDCIGQREERNVTVCNTNPCNVPVEGGFSPWGPWDNPQCSVSCGGGIRRLTRRRTCDNPPPSFGGRNCTGDFEQINITSCNTFQCPINGGFTDWSQWDNPQCSVSCGGGNRTRTRRRTCTQPPPQFNGNDCIGQREERNVTVCNTNPCDVPVEGGFSPWGPWDNPQCSVSCGGGIRRLTRRRTCDNPPPSFGGRNCTGDFEQINITSCNTFQCPINGGFTDWSQWDNPQCSVSCGGGSRTRTRRRTCTQPPPQFNGNDCIGQREERNVTVCNTNPCDVPVEGGFSPWGPWDNPQCSVSCGGGIRRLTRRRTCDNPPPSFGGRNCTGDFEQINITSCNTFQCPINGGFTDWSQWDNPQCSVSCGGGNRTRTRRRTCTQPPPQFNGNDCIGQREERNVTVCNTNPCDVPVEGGFSPWGPWDNPQCSVSCGGGIRRLTRRRTCDNPPPSFGGRNCTGDFEQINITSCNTFQCPINGGFTDWSQWDNPQCSVSCGGGNRTRTRRRTCTQPPPQFNGNDCIGQREERNVTVCNTNPCDVPVEGGFSPWVPWDNPQCSVTCGGGIRRLTRRRTCDNPPPVFGGRNCTGDFQQINVTNCNTFQCPTYGLCNDTQRVDEIGYRYHPTDCDKYIQCYYNPNGNVIGVYRSCPFGQYWDQANRRCEESNRISCPLEKCTSSCISSYKMDGSCSSYWTCNKKRSVGKYCAAGFSYVPNRGCRANYACEDLCVNSYIPRDLCKKRPVWNNTTTSYEGFSHSLLGWTRSSCFPSTYFDIVDCGCTQQRKCQASHSLMFQSSTFPVWVSANNVNVVNGVAFFDVNSRLSLNVEILTYPAGIKLRFREQLAVTRRRVLLSSSDCRNSNNFVLSVIGDGLHFEVTTGSDDVSEMTISTVGMPIAEWKTVSIVYDGHFMLGIVESSKIKYMAKVHAPRSAILKCGLRIGTDGLQGLSSAFSGSIDMVSVYPCDPNFLS